MNWGKGFILRKAVDLEIVLLCCAIRKKRSQVVFFGIVGGLLEACFSFLLTLTPYPKNVPFINSQLGSPHNNLATTLSVTQVTSPLKNAGYTAGWVCAAGSWIPEPTAQPHSRQSNPNPYPTTDSKLNWTYKFSHFFTPVYTL